jgi:hypothetical protein
LYLALTFSNSCRNLSQLANGSGIKVNSNIFTINFFNKNTHESSSNPLNKTNYICPSSILFKLPLDDLKISDKLKRIELNLPEINKNKIVYDPLLINQLEENRLPERNTSAPMSCGKPLFNERAWRSRMMNKKKRKKYRKKMFFVLKKRQQDKEKRYQNLCLMYKQIEEKKSEIYDPIRFIHRELEKAKFFGYKCTPIYDEFRDLINTKMNTFDEKLTRKFEDIKKPLHMIYTDVIKPEELLTKSERKKGAK